MLNVVNLYATDPFMDYVCFKVRDHHEIEGLRSIDDRLSDDPTSIGLSTTDVKCDREMLLNAPQ